MASRAGTDSGRVGALLAVNPNPSVDRVWSIPGFRAGGEFRVERVWARAGGKGCNAARVAADLTGASAREPAAREGSGLGGSATREGSGLGGPATREGSGRAESTGPERDTPFPFEGIRVLVTGFLAGTAGDFVERDLRRSGVEPAFLRLAGDETRTCPTIVDPRSGEVTEIREPGPVLTEDDVVAFEGHFSVCLERLAGSPVVVTLSGSLPPGAPADFYARLVRAAARLRVPCVLDASGEALWLGVGAGPWAVKVNQKELVGLDPTPAAGEEVTAVAERLARLVAGGVSLAVVTMGRRGLLAHDGRTVWRGTLEGDLEVVQPVGSGDAATGALGLGLVRLLASGALAGRDWPSLGFGTLPGSVSRDLVRDMVAAGAANAATEGIGTCPPAVFAAMRERVRVEAGP